MRLVLCNLEEDSNQRGSDSGYAILSRSNVSPRVASRKSSPVEGTAAEECRLWLVPCRADCTAGYGFPCYSCATRSFLESSRQREHTSNPSFSSSGGVVVVGSSLGGKLNVIPRTLQMMAARAFPRSQIAACASERRVGLLLSCGFHAKQLPETPTKRAVAKNSREYTPTLPPTCGMC